MKSGWSCSTSIGSISCLVTVTFYLLLLIFQYVKWSGWESEAMVLSQETVSSSLWFMGDSVLVRGSKWTVTPMLLLLSTHTLLGGLGINPEQAGETMLCISSKPAAAGAWFWIRGRRWMDEKCLFYLPHRWCYRAIILTALPLKGLEPILTALPLKVLEPIPAVTAWTGPVYHRGNFYEILGQINKCIQRHSHSRHRTWELLAVMFLLCSVVLIYCLLHNIWDIMETR